MMMYTLGVFPNIYTFLIGIVMKFYHIYFDINSGSWVQTWILSLDYDCNKFDDSFGHCPLTGFIKDTAS